MDATTTPLITSLVAKLQLDYPAYHFTKSHEFRWSPAEQTIFYDDATNDSSSLLHELAHAVLGHTHYLRDIELLALERAAWEHAATSLAPIYGTAIASDVVEDALDTYRDWLHARSTCPHCGATGIQVKDHHYRCITCFTQWRVNDARSCALRRWKTPKQQKERP